MPQPNQAAISQRASAAALTRLGVRRPTAPELDPAFVQLNPGGVPPGRGPTVDRAVRLRRAEEIETLGFGVVADMNTESRANRPSVRHHAVQRRAERAQRLASERGDRPERRQAERAGRQAQAQAGRAVRSSRPHPQEREAFPDAR